MFAITMEATGLVTVRNFPQDSYPFLRDAVGGFIEAVDFSCGDKTYTLWVNEEGKIYGLPANQGATFLVKDSIAMFDYIAGDAVITGGTGDEGETLSLSQDDVNNILSTLGI